MKKVSLTFLLFILFTISGWACSCHGPGVINKDEIKVYEVIFRGTATKVERNHVKNIIAFRIDKLYKGQIQDSIIQIFASPSDGMCGIFPKIGEEWLIYAWQFNQNFTTNSCSRTVNLNKNSYNYLRDKNRIKKDIVFLEARLKKYKRKN